MSAGVRYVTAQRSRCGEVRAQRLLYDGDWSMRRAPIGWMRRVVHVENTLPLRSVSRDTLCGLIPQEGTRNSRRPALPDNGFDGFGYNFGQPQTGT